MIIHADEDTAGHQEQLTRQGCREQALAKKGQGVFCRPLPKAPISFLLIYFNWKIITLQYFDGFCPTPV